MQIVSTAIISVNGIPIDPTPAQIVEHFSPRQRLTVDVEEMPTELLEENPARIELANSSAAIEVLHNSWPFVEPGGPGTLTPVVTPCPAIRDDASLRAIHFDICNFFNFSRMLGTGSTWVKDVANNTAYVLGRACITAEPWRIQVEEVENVAAVVKQREGIRVAHTGNIRRIDGNTFRAGEVLRLLRHLRLFLSFAGGSGVGLSRVEGDDDQGSRVPIRWGTEHINMGEQSRFSWLPQHSATDAISSVFAEYYRQIGGKDPRRFAIDNALASYVENLDAALLADLPRIQIALESLCSLTINRIGRMQDALEKTLRRATIPLDVPLWLNRLDVFRKAEGWATGPDAFVKLRNWMVHGNPRIEGVCPSVLWEACELALWYVELLLLHQFNYQGRYRIRANGSVASVPWAP